MQKIEKILIIDDDPDAIEVLDMHLEKLNYEIQSTTDPLKSHEIISDFFPDLIILDWEMPDKDGMVILKEIKENFTSVEIPIIISTGVRIRSEDLKTALDCGASDFISKPIDPIILEARVSSSLRKKTYVQRIRESYIQKSEREIGLLMQEKQRLSMELSKIDSNLLMTAISVFQNKQMLAKIKEDVFANDTELDMNNRVRLMQIFNKYDNLCRSQNWLMFEKMYSNSNESFFKCLVSRYPSLTQAELRICSFFKMGLSNKEIAALSYSNYDALRKAVYRIRKKLQLEQNVSLGTFFQQIC